MRNILTVCLGNICRSPYAASVLQHRGSWAVDARSAGLSDKWTGQPAHEEMLELAAARGFDLAGHRATQVTPELLEWADVVLAMDYKVLDELRRQADPTVFGKITFYLDDQDVPDPYDGTTDDFARAADLIQQGAHRHLP
ncbi:low molecular weight phosphotyrosine protein phosphatase [Streptomyces aquilus]|uniref:protein-tyrosine-phosphatase n=1 Tax=Streptomyces aquilus TaxID=2548456 RepID=A0A3Q9BVF0_9ACTN|nr:low molecular weight protein-tyrosine-phosphatase [Streptomyces aquilus]AZP14736.1 low molecular weight phosphotyrosine protein phosphatase [Streptomyces aquilus]AZP22968.1 low molecular weight phosphotyrosine protein phosphatase [Streptomyces aquilus]